MLGMLAFPSMGSKLFVDLGVWAVVCWVGSGWSGRWPVAGGRCGGFRCDGGAFRVLRFLFCLFLSLFFACSVSVLSFCSLRLDFVSFACTWCERFVFLYFAFDLCV